MYRWLVTIVTKQLISGMILQELNCIYLNPPVTHDEMVGYRIAGMCLVGFGRSIGRKQGFWYLEVSTVYSTYRSMEISMAQTLSHWVKVLQYIIQVYNMYWYVRLCIYIHSMYTVYLYIHSMYIVYNIYIYLIIYIHTYIYILYIYIYIIAHDHKLGEWVTYGLAMLPDPVLQWDVHPPYRRLMLNRCLKTWTWRCCLAEISACQADDDWFAGHIYTYMYVYIYT